MDLRIQLQKRPISCIDSRGQVSVLQVEEGVRAKESLKSELGWELESEEFLKFAVEDDGLVRVGVE